MSCSMPEGCRSLAHLRELLGLRQLSGHFRREILSFLQSVPHPSLSPYILASFSVWSVRSLALLSLRGAIGPRDV